MMDDEIVPPTILQRKALVYVHRSTDVRRASERSARCAAGIVPPGHPPASRSTAGSEDLSVAGFATARRRRSPSPRRPVIPARFSGGDVRKGDNRRYEKGGTYRGGNNNIVVAPGGGHGGCYYYEDDDDNELGAALVGGVIGLGIGAAIAGSDAPANTCIGNNGDGICDAP